METEFYTCEYCYKEFEPKRRRVQKYCSNTCRSKAHHARKTTSKITKVESLEIVPIESAKIDKPSIGKIDKMSASGVGNSAIGTLTADTLKHILTAPQNRPSTKGDIANLKALIKRYHKVKNLPPNTQGALPYFDIETGEVKYSFMPFYG
ncbi:lysozyme family protein [Bizionia myxarmorum]|uniref:Uncharacterized protein n=1 Tax=Bizionia myxarmorum TaxID=291186 RepID=A0A5D0QZX0_9FLAO|nr:hypothetical protein [Bizionia myxarmorum]TYB74369.1 hypothetical protein ES674_14560 [Bizionia myxarmorum]